MNLAQFKEQQYINLETFRRNGQGVKTPVWFAQDGDSLLIWTETNSGKAKRIRNNEKVRIVPSTGAGAPVGKWVEAQAYVDDSSEALNHVCSLLKQKYGFIFTLLRKMHELRKTKYTAIKVGLQ